MQVSKNVSILLPCPHLRLIDSSVVNVNLGLKVNRVKIWVPPHSSGLFRPEMDPLAVPIPLGLVCPSFSLEFRLSTAVVTRRPMQTIFSFLELPGSDSAFLDQVILAASALSGIMMANLESNFWSPASLKRTDSATFKAVSSGQKVSSDICRLEWRPMALAKSHCSECRRSISIYSNK